MQAYRDQYAQVKAKGAQVVGISTDDPKTLKRFKEEHALPFPLLSDAKGEVARKYGGTLPVVGLAKRATFVVDRGGTVREIVTGGDAIEPAGAIAACPAPQPKGIP